MASNKRILLKQNVFDSALDRIRYIFDEFENVIVGISGGKDSTVTLELALIVAKEKNRLPLKVLFLDQEGEWQGTIDNIKYVMSRPEVEPIWLQTQFLINNAVSFGNEWVKVWDKDAEGNWIRDKDPMSRKDEGYDKMDWYHIFQAIIKKEFGNKKACYLAGVRAEESPRRAQGLTSQATYKAITWGKILNRAHDQYTFYPLYDWSYTDVWKAIHDNKWVYNVVYDKMYQYGVQLNDMRISSLFHETSLRSLFWLQEIERDTYNAFTRRIEGSDMASKLGNDDFYCPKELPYMFQTWREYRDYLLEKLVVNEEHKQSFKDKFDNMQELYYWCFGDGLYRKQISSILANDFIHTKLNNIVIPKEKYDEYKRRRQEIRDRAKQSTQSVSDQQDQDDASSAIGEQ